MTPEAFREFARTVLDSIGEALRKVPFSEGQESQYRADCLAEAGRTLADWEARGGVKGTIRLLTNDEPLMVLEQVRLGTEPPATLEVVLEDPRSDVGLTGLLKCTPWRAESLYERMTGRRSPLSDPRKKLKG